MNGKGKWATVASLAVLLALAAGAAARADQPEVKLPALLSAPPVKPAGGDDELRRLLKAAHNAAVAAAKDSYEQFTQGRLGTSALNRALQRVVQSGLELCDTPEKKVALLTQFVAATEEVEKIMQERLDLGRCSIGDAHQVRCDRLEAEVQLLRAKRAAERAGGK